MSLDELLQQASTFIGRTLEELQAEPVGEYERTTGRATRDFKLDNKVSILVVAINKTGWHFEKNIPGSVTFYLYTHDGLKSVNEYAMIREGQVNKEAADLFKKEFTIITQHPDWVRCEVCGEFIPDTEASQSGFAGSVCSACLAKGYKTQPIDTLGD